MEKVNFCSRCGVEWVAGSEQCHKCGMVLKRFRPSADNPYRAKVIRLDEAKQQGYQEFTVIGGMPDEGWGY